MKKSTINIALLVFAFLTIVLSIWGPEILTAYKDKSVLNSINVQEVENEGEGYRYQLSSNEKLFLLSACLNSQAIPESEQSALTREKEESYQDLTGTYAFVVNHKGPSGKEITDEEIYVTCNEEINTLKELGILPEEVKEILPASYDATLYSAIDVLEPRNNVAVWKVSLLSSQQNANKTNRLLDAYIDADDGKIYEVYVRTEKTWEEIDPDKIMEKWSSYLGLYGMELYETENPLLETTPYYKKYVFPGMGEDRCIVTIGFYEGIGELFIKITK